MRHPTRQIDLQRDYNDYNDSPAAAGHGAKPGAFNRAAERYAHVIPIQRIAKPKRRGPVQRTAMTGPDPFDYRAMSGTNDVSTIAAAGVASASEALPYAQKIQQRFGHHDISGIKVASGAAAKQASAAIGARAYATGNKIAFAGAPDLHTAAHEAAHVVQQRAGVRLKGTVGQVGDRYEQHADRVADLVVRGESAQETLDEMAVGCGTNHAVQRIADDDECPNNESQAASAVMLAAGYLNLFGKPGDRGPAPAPWTDAVEQIRVAATDRSIAASVRLKKLDSGVVGLSSAVELVSVELAAQFGEAADYGRAQLQIEELLGHKQAAAELDAVCEQIESLDAKASLISQIATAQGLLGPGVEAAWEPITISLPGETKMVAIPTRNEIGLAVTALKAIVNIWAAGEKLSDPDVNADPLEQIDTAVSAVGSLCSSIIGVSVGLMEQISAAHPNKQTAEAFANVASGLGDAAKALGGVMGLFGGVIALNVNAEKLIDTSLPAIDRADAAVGVISAMGTLAESTVGLAELVMGGEAVAASGMLSGLATFGTAVGFLGPMWFMVRAMITEFPKIKNFANELCNADAEQVREMGSEMARLADRLIIADELDVSGGDPLMTEAKNNAFHDLQQFVLNWPTSNIRWFSVMRDGVTEAVAGCGMAEAESPREAITAAQILMASLQTLFDNIWQMIQQELGLSDDEMPKQHDAATK